eukprot:TRINITY_DN9657_c0_g2_i1.p1 TRINITY_DN9657_c0_g2~~TRINITY_DN9657_c0_g2_i1.p1  ORF type:complete len:1181 (+),score=264.47 TRINITY_DN9657_c0_g2_i1:100-3642(+)
MGGRSASDIHNVCKEAAYHSDWAGKRGHSSWGGRRWLPGSRPRRSTGSCFNLSDRHWKGLALCLVVLIGLSKAWWYLASGRSRDGGCTEAGHQAAFWDGLLEWLFGGESHGSAEERRLAGSHNHEALMFLLMSLFFGTGIVYLLTFEIFHGLQQTVALFCLGMVLSLVRYVSGFDDPGVKQGVIGRSYNMWMEIDPHMMLQTLLPALLAGDAMSIDTAVAGKVAKQCLYLAGPGVLIQALLAGSFLYTYLPFGWSYMTALTLAAILCATDPVAVVALLKELGASDTLTLQIQGESLLNDGTAIVLYQISYRALKGETFDIFDIVTFLIHTAMYAWMFGMAVGLIFFLMIKMSADRLNHSSPTIQVVLTLICAYASFIVAENVFKISGVLATVASSLVLAHLMWPVIVDRESMHVTWHMFEYLGNTIIFFLAGALTGKSMLSVTMSDYFHLLVIYGSLMSIRGFFLFVSRPILMRLSPTRKPISVPEAIVMSWGGLRGAVGLALGIQVSMERADGKLSQLDADRFLFYVGGIAFLTLLVNAQTCPALVDGLGVAKMRETKKQMLGMFYKGMNDRFQRMVAQARESGKLPIDGKVREEVRKVLFHMVNNVYHHEENAQNPEEAEEMAAHVMLRTYSASVTSLLGRMGIQQSEKRKPELEMTPRRASSKDGRRVVNEQGQRILDSVKLLESGFDCSLRLQEGISNLRDQFVERRCDTEHLGFLLGRETVDHFALRTIVEVFHDLLKVQYWHQIEGGIRVNGSVEADILLASVESSASLSLYDLTDLEFVVAHTNTDDTSLCTFFAGIGKSGEKLATLNLMQKLRTTPKSAEPRRCAAIAHSDKFNYFMMFIIVLNTAVIIMEDSKVQSTTFMLIEIFFTTVYFIEFVIKFEDARMKYFSRAWNVFDFTLLVVGLLGLVFQFMDGTSVAAGEAAQTAKINRTLKTLRLGRMLKFCRLVESAWRHRRGKDTTEDMCATMGSINLFEALIHAHVEAQSALVKYLCRDNTPDTSEIAQVLLQSQATVYKALVLVDYEKEQLTDEYIIEDLSNHLASYQVAMELEHFLMETHTNGVISGSEAHTLMHPIHHGMALLQNNIKGMRLGVPLSKLKMKTAHSMRQQPSDRAEPAHEPPPGGKGGWPARKKSCDDMSFKASIKPASAGDSSTKASSQVASSGSSKRSGPAQE